MARVEILAVLVVLMMCVHENKATHAFCQTIPAVQGRCRSSCMSHEIISPVNSMNWGCQNSPDVGYLPYCCMDPSARCEVFPSDTGKCRASCQADEVVSAVAVENQGCLDSPKAGNVPNCCLKNPAVCEMTPPVPGVCRSSCRSGEILSSVVLENTACKVGGCCKKVTEVACVNIKASASASANLPGHPADCACDGKMNTKWMPPPPAALPQWVMITFTGPKLLARVKINRKSNKNLKQFMMEYDSSSSPAYNWPNSEGRRKTINLTPPVNTGSIKIKILQKFNPGSTGIYEIQLYELSPP